jgi:hypothetical protein
VERGDAGPGRDAYGLRGRRRLGERRAYRSGRGAEGPGAGGTNGENGPDTDEDDEYYGQLLRRPGDRPAYPRQPSRPRMRQPGRFPPPAGPYPPNGSPGYPPNVNPADRYPRRSNPADRYPPNGDAAAGGPVSGGPVSGGPVSGGPVSGAPMGRSPVSGAAYGDAVTGGPRPGRNGRWLPPAADRPYRSPVPGSVGGNRGRRGPGQDPPGEMWRRPARPSAGPAAAPGRGGAGGYGGTAGTRRETAVPGERPAGAVPSTGPSTGPSVASIAPDGLESFARDLRALRAKAELDYPELAERSHYTMKTLASAAGGLRLPTLPVAVAYVRACGGDLAEWEDRWQKLAGKITADGAKRAPSEGEEQQARPEPAAAASSAEPPVRPAAPDPDPGPGEVYVITSARPRQPGWPGGQGAG